MNDITNLTIDQLWQDIEKMLNDNPNPFKELNAIYQFDLLGDDGGTYQLVFANGTAEILRENFLEPKCTLQMKGSDFKEFLQGNMNSAAAFIMGKLKVQGSLGLALKLENLLGKYEL
ncbi:SCP2 sterol-binding domain-containing protein [Heyndrickxia sp. NPDC080065]|uniref:SCP2 sterol-binding domain-containing protein n=1 Tax=Heyndrickxia sp. NPDC080065 TaxID=3390568 RepID=UPI003D0906AC